jgi:DNA-binding CsgD family transcriptional regulator
VGKSKMVRAADVVRLLRLRDELDDLPAAGDARWRHVMDATCRLFGAVLSASGEGVGFLPGPRGEPRYTGAVESGSLDMAERSHFYRYLQGDQCVDPCVRALAAVPARLFTRSREQLCDDAEWYRLEHVNVDRRGARVDAVLFSGYRPDREGEVRMIALHRPWGEGQRYTERDRTLLHLLHRAVAKKVYAAAQTEVHGPKRFDPLSVLSPRLAETFALLMQGLPEKQVAARLGVTRNTAHSYVKEIYARLNVESRPELLAAFGQSGGGDRPNGRQPG